VRKVVLDTNVLVVSVSSKSKLHWVFKKLLEKEYTLCVTTEILSEYAEILERLMNKETSASVMGVLENLSNVEYITTYYRFRLLKDEDDDKFIDCAIASNASYIVSHDKDFKVLESLTFPKVKVIDTDTFKKDIFWL
jgi:putative PIN family toxin of toxin-antitoxin system